MSKSEMIKSMNGLGSVWHQFQDVNDRRDYEIKTNGSADPVTDNQVSKMSNVLDEHNERIENLEVKNNRPKIGGVEYKFKNPAEKEYKKAIDLYLRKGVDASLPALEKKALSVTSDPDGGYLVSPSVSEHIVKTIFESSPMRQISRTETISTDALELIEDKEEAVSGWTTETASVTDTATPKIGKKNIPVHELYAQPKATQKLIDDSSIDIEQWLAGKIADVFSRKENTAFINGDGVGKPRGILTYTAGTDWGEIEQINSGTNGAITTDSLVQLFYSLKEDYAVGATFLMNRAAVQQARLLKDSNGQYLWQPGLTQGTPDTLLGVPVFQAADMPIPATDSLSVALGDFRRAYQVVDRTGVRILRDPFTDKPFVKFYSTKRVGGDVVNFEAIKLLKLAS